jgi:putative nucleotidyltransferase with HDIG domain
LNKTTTKYDRDNAMHEHIQQRIQQVIANLDQLPSIPLVVTKIINMVNDPEVDFKKVAEEISKDQAITTDILRISNSAYYSKGKEISSVDRAIITLGIKEVKDIIVLSTAKQILNKPVVGYDLEKGDLWKHNLVVAMLAKKMALDKKRRDIADEVFTGGIIHDVGKTILALFVANVFKEIITMTQEKHIPFTDAEKEVMGFNHQEIGDKVLQKWQFPDTLRAIVLHHHTPMAAPEPYRTHVAFVHIANSIALMAGVGIGSDGLFHELSEEAVKLTGFTPAELENLYAHVPELLNQAKSIL